MSHLLSHKGSVKEASEFGLNDFLLLILISSVLLKKLTCRYYKLKLYQNSRLDMKIIKFLRKMHYYSRVVIVIFYQSECLIKSKILDSSEYKNHHQMETAKNIHTWSHCVLHMMNSESKSQKNAI